MSLKDPSDNSQLSDHQLGQKLAVFMAQQATSNLPYSNDINQLQDMLGEDTALLGPLRDLLGRAAFKQLVGQERNKAQIGARDALLEDLGRTYNSHMVERLGVVINGCLGLQSTLLRTGDQQSVQKPLVSSISKSPIHHPTPGKSSTAASQKAFAFRQTDGSDSSIRNQKRSILIAMVSLLSGVGVIALTLIQLRPWSEQTSITSKSKTTPPKISNSDDKPKEYDQPSEEPTNKTELPKSPLILEASDLQNGEKKELIGSSIRVKFSVQPSDSDKGDPWTQPVAEVYENGTLVSSMRGTERHGFQSSAAQVQIVDLDQSNDTEEVLLSSFTGGAHCCGTVHVLSKNSQTQRWEEATVGPFDGGPITAVDPLGGSQPLIATHDNRFLYKFASYAGSAAPAQFWRLEHGRFSDVSHDRSYKNIHAKNLISLERGVKEFPYGDYNPNGILAAYVATKVLLGQAKPGWEVMLEKYDPNEDWGLKECRGGYDKKGKCRQEVVYSNYPEALLAFLLSLGYLTSDEADQLRSIEQN